MPLPTTGTVFGIDVGYSATKKTTGMACLWWDAKSIHWSCENCSSDETDRRRRVWRRM